MLARLKPPTTPPPGETPPTDSEGFKDVIVSPPPLFVGFPVTGSSVELSVGLLGPPTLLVEGLGLSALGSPAAATGP